MEQLIFVYTADTLSLCYFMELTFIVNQASPSCAYFYGPKECVSCFPI